MAIRAAAAALSACLACAADAVLPDGAGRIAVPDAWRVSAARPLVLLGAAAAATDAPRLAVTATDAPAADAAASLRAGYARIADGCEILDDDDAPLGGRVWRRLRVRFATGPVLFGQVAWVGTVGTRTVVAVLSAPDERIGAALPAASAAVASISAPR